MTATANTQTQGENAPHGSGVEPRTPPMPREEGAAGQPDAYEYGVEGTNKTLPEPKPDGQPSEELGNNVTPRHIEKSPYTRG
ncbi:hypothetical protein [Polaromonas sp.]|uniref:hypothetical protein n=1 Tax=Polaromonas sp. TaxID=1869339 RepID=UPI003265C7B1